MSVQLASPMESATLYVALDDCEIEAEQLFAATSAGCNGREEGALEELRALMESEAAAVVAANHEASRSSSAAAAATLVQTLKTAIANAGRSSAQTGMDSDDDDDDDDEDEDEDEDEEAGDKVGNEDGEDAAEKEGAAIEGGTAAGAKKKRPEQPRPEDIRRREWSAEKQKIMRAKVSEMLALEDKHTDAVSTKVAELQEAQRSKAPAMKPMCVAEEAACLKCYQDEFAKNEAGDVLKCAALVDAYRLCARAAAQDLLERK